MHRTRLRVYVQNAPVRTGTKPTCFIHVGLVPVHTRLTQGSYLSVEIHAHQLASELGMAQRGNPGFPAFAWCVLDAIPLCAQIQTPRKRIIREPAEFKHAEERTQKN